MKFYVTSDLHGFYDQFITTLSNTGWFNDEGPKKLIVCGDLLDRGSQAKELVDFMLTLKQKNQLIFIRGNHEDLYLDLLYNFEKYRIQIITNYCHHISNGTWDTSLQLADISEREALSYTDIWRRSNLNSLFRTELIINSIEYYETKNFIFVHGWIPANAIFDNHSKKHFTYNSNWRKVSNKEWNSARWLCGPNLGIIDKVLEPNKTIVCGHWNCSAAHHLIDGTSEFEQDANFNTFKGDGIWALDACTAYSNKVNIEVIEDEIIDE